MEEYVSENRYNIRSLVNIYYEISNLQQYSAKLSRELSEKLKKTPNFLNAFLTILLLKAAAINRVKLQEIDYFLVEFAIRRYETQSFLFDLTQKASVFLYLSQLEVSFVNEKKLFPLALIEIKEELMKKAEELSENNILKIFEAFLYLPLDFDTKLLRNLYEIVLKKILQEPNQVNSLFLRDLHEKICGIMKKKNVFVKNLAIIENELGNRMENFAFFNKINNISRLIYVVHESKNKIFVGKIKNILNSLIENEENCYLILEYLHCKNVDISEFLMKVIIFYIKYIKYDHFFSRLRKKFKFQRVKLIK